MNEEIEGLRAEMEALRVSNEHLRAEVDRLRMESIGNTRLGPRAETQADIDARTQRLTDVIERIKAENGPLDLSKHQFSTFMEDGTDVIACRVCRRTKPELEHARMSQCVPSVDRSKLCTTSGEPPEKVRAEQTEATGQHKAYIVLCAEERAKGFVRPYRDAYRHVGLLVDRCQQTKQESSDENPHQCERPAGHDGDHEYSALMLIKNPVPYMIKRTMGCGAVTTMGRALSETYARDPTFYGATFCVMCNRHLPVAEFVWTADGERVGS